MPYFDQKRLVAGAKEIFSVTLAKVLAFAPRPK